jgi:hypothetical protein
MAEGRALRPGRFRWSYWIGTETAVSGLASALAGAVARVPGLVGGCRWTPFVHVKSTLEQEIGRARGLRLGEGRD